MLETETKIYRGRNGQQMVYIPKDMVRDSQYPFSDGTIVQVQVMPDEEKVVIKRGDKS